MKAKWIRPPKGDMTVIFIHGILSDGDACWKHPDGAWWPDLLKDEPDLEHAGIYVFTYHTGVTSGNFRIGDAVDTLWEYAKVDKVFEKSRRIVFVCHSMGGILARRFIVKHQQFLAERSRPVGLFLVASPSLGSDYANWLSVVTRFMGHTQAQALRFSQQNDWLNDLDRDFQDLIRAENPPFPVKGKELIEDKSIVLKKLWRKQIVEPHSGARYFGESVKIPLSDHSSIAKPVDAEALQHRILCGFLLEMPEAVSTETPSDANGGGSGGGNISVNAGGDAAVSTGNGRSVIIKNSKVGACGDHVTVKGGIHF